MSLARGGTLKLHCAKESSGCSNGIGGVSFLGLYAYIQEKGYKLWPSCPAIGWGSIVGNATERGFGYNPNGEYSEQLCGMEVVLGTGEDVRTGMGALEGSPMWPLFRGGYDPSIDELFFQSNVGIVTKVGMHMTAAPAHYIDCKVSVPNQDQLAILVKTLSALEREGISQNHASVTNPYREGLTNTPLDLTLSPRVLGPTYFAIYGASAAIIKAHWASVEEAITPIPGVKSEVKTHECKDGQRFNAPTISGVSIAHIGVPSIDAAQIVSVRGQGGGHICFSPLFSPDGVQMQEWLTRTLRMTEEASFDMFADFHVYGSYVIAIALVVYGPNEGSRVKKLFENLLEDGAKTGMSEYRTHIDYMDDVRKHFGFNNGALGNLLTQIKEVTDPNGILPQGKSGIWTKVAALKRS